MQQSTKAACVLLAGLLSAGVALTTIPEPDHIFYGAVSPDGSGVLWVATADDAPPLAVFAIGSLAERFVLRVPMDSIGPRRPGAVRAGDTVGFYHDGVAIGNAVVSQRGTAQSLDLFDVGNGVGVDIGDVTVVEGDTGTVEAVFAVTLHPAATTAVLVAYSVGGGTATSGTDYLTAADAPIVFAPGETEQSIVVEVVGDGLPEPDETFVVTLANTGEVPLLREQATGTILDDDATAPPRIVIDSVRVSEGDREAVAQLTLSSAREGLVSVDWMTFDGTALAGEDYVMAGGTATFAPGETQASIAVPLIDDAVAEPRETFIVRLSNAQAAVLGADTATIAVVDDDLGSDLVVDRTVVGAAATRITFEDEFTEPVVIVGPATRLGANGGTAVLMGVDTAGFDWRFGDWDSADEIGEEEVSYLTIEAGRSTMADGSSWEAGLFDLDLPGVWTRVAFDEPFRQPPIVLLTAQSSPSAMPVTLRVRAIDSDGFEAAFRYADNAGSAVSIGFVAIDGSTKSGFVAADGTERSWVQQRLVVSERPTPVLSYALALDRVRQPGRTSHSNSSRQSGPSLTESVSALAVDTHLFAQLGPRGAVLASIGMLVPRHTASVEWGTAVGIDESWTRVPLARVYDDTVVVAEPFLYPGVDSYALRVRNVSESSFEVRCVSLTQPDAGCPEIRIHYLVAQAGEHLIAGLEVQAGRTEVARTIDEGWQIVHFNRPFGEVPAIFAEAQSARNAGGVLGRTHDSGREWFSLALQPVTTIVASEDVGWIAIERGSGDTVDGREIRVFSRTLDDLRGRRGSPPNGPAAAEPEIGDLVILGDVASSYFPIPSLICFEHVARAILDGRLVSGGAASGVVEDAVFFQAGWIDRTATSPPAPVEASPGTPTIR